MSLIALRLTTFVLRIVPPHTALALGGLLGHIVYALAPWRLAVVRANLRRAGLATRLERAVYVHLGRALLLSLRSPCTAAVVADDDALAALWAVSPHGRDPGYLVLRRC